MLHSNCTFRKHVFHVSTFDAFLSTCRGVSKANYASCCITFTSAIHLPLDAGVLCEIVKVRTVIMRSGVTYAMNCSTIGKAIPVPVWTGS